MPSDFPSTKQTLTVPETARLLGVSERLIYKQTKLGALPAVRVGQRVVIPCSVIERMLGEATS